METTSHFHFITVELPPTRKKVLDELLLEGQWEKRWAEQTSQGAKWMGW